MKKLLKVMIPVILVIACMFTFAVSAEAASPEMEQAMSQFAETYAKTSARITEQQTRQDVFEIFGVCIVAIAMILGIVCVGYIAYVAPECGMSRLWAIAPLINNVLGLIVFIVVFTRKKNGRSRKAAVVITCPTCGGKHQEGAGFCSICGTKL